MPAFRKIHSLFILVLVALLAVSLMSVAAADRVAPGAQLRFYSNEDGRPAAATSGIAGGKVWLALELSLASRQRVDPLVRNVTVRLAEASPLHTAGANHVDITVDLTSAASWEKWSGNGREAANQSPLMPAVAARRYRRTVQWQTTKPWLQKNSRLIGHNGVHVASVVAVNGDDGKQRIPFQQQSGKAWSTLVTPPTFPARVNIRNLAISVVQPQDYVIVGQRDAKTKQRPLVPPFMDITLEDNNLSQPITVEVTLRNTSLPLRVVRTLRLSNVTGSSQRLGWDGRSDAGQDVPVGFYTFDVKVVQPADRDVCTYRSRFLYTRAEDFDFEVEDESSLSPPPISTDEQGRTRVFATYELSEIPAPGSVTVRLFDLTVRVQQTVAGLSDRKRDERTPVLLFSLFPEFTKPGGNSYQSIVTARDARASYYHDHRNRPMLARG